MEGMRKAPREVIHQGGTLKPEKEGKQIPRINIERGEKRREISFCCII